MNHIANLQHRRDRAARKITIETALEQRYPWLRLAVVLGGLLVVFVAFQMLPAGLAWLVLFGGALLFGWVANRHEAVIARIRKLQAFQAMLDGHIARAALDWPNIPAPAQIPVTAEHPFAADLQITGGSSLHQLLDTTASLGGSQLLAEWLLETSAQPQAAAQRQRLARALIDHPAFRTSLELDGLLARPDGARHFDTNSLLAWLDRHTHGAKLRAFLLGLSALAAANIILFALNALGLLPPFWIATIAVYMGLQSLRFRETSETFEESYTLANQLKRLRLVLVHLEQARFAASSPIAELVGAFQSGQRPSSTLRRIDRIVSAASLRNNPFLSLFLNLLVPWDVYFTYRLEQVKAELQGSLPAWLAAWHRLEALAALANFSTLHPETTFPVFLPADASPVLDAVQMGHPLIPAGQRINNNCQIPALGQVGIITGSNMSGKSTFLRTLGVNMVLMNAGSAVAAQELRAVPMRIFTSMTLTDSLSDGISFFYAEVRRLKALLDALEAPSGYPLFFLIDEIFRGTNNRERQVGSQSYTRALTGKNGAGFISTHDLELANLADTLPQVVNYHFREDIREDRMVFDYTLRPGPSPTTNALRIMALAGLPVTPKAS